MVVHTGVLCLPLEHFGRLESRAARKQVRLIPVQDQAEALRFVVFNPIGPKARSRTDGQQRVEVVKKFARVFIEAQVQVMEGDRAWDIQFEVHVCCLIVAARV